MELEILLIVLLFFIVWVIAVLLHPGWRQGWRNSKFLDSLDRDDGEIKELRKK